MPAAAEQSSRLTGAQRTPMNKSIPHIKKYMSTDVQTIGDEQPMSVAHQMMRDRGIRHLPVLHQGKLVGVVTDRDLRLVETLRDVDPADVAGERSNDVGRLHGHARRRAQRSRRLDGAEQIRLCRGRRPWARGRDLHHRRRLQRLRRATVDATDALKRAQGRGPGALASAGGNPGRPRSRWPLRPSYGPADGL